MTIGAIVQARMSSVRLPGKVLRPLGGKPMLAYTLERLARATSVDRVIVATSREMSDGPIADFCRQQGISCFRGSLPNVAERFLNIMDAEHFDACVRICADSPFVDQRIVDQAVGIFRNGEYDLVTNTLVRSFPMGQSVEVLRADTFRRAYNDMTEGKDREHVTRFFYTNKDRFRIHNFSASSDHSTVQLSVDTPEDFAMAEKIIRAMDRPQIAYGWEEILALRQKLLQ